MSCRLSNILHKPVSHQGDTTEDKAHLQTAAETAQLASPQQRSDKIEGTAETAEAAIPSAQDAGNPQESASQGK